MISYKISNLNLLNEYLILYKRCFPGFKKNIEYFSWLYGSNPMGNYIGIDAFDGDKLIGQIGGIPLNFKNRNKIFFKFNIYLKNYRDNINKCNLKKLKDDIGVFNIIKKSNIKSSDDKIILNILNNVMPGKSTSEHVSNGVMYNKKFNIHKNKIENIELFGYIRKHFN